MMWFFTARERYFGSCLLNNSQCVNLSEDLTTNRPLYGCGACWIIRWWKNIFVTLPLKKVTNELKETTR